MRSSAVSFLARLGRSRAIMDTVLQETAVLPQRAGGLAEALRSLWPSSSLYACLLGEETAWQGGVLDRAGRPHPEWAPLVCDDIVGGMPSDRARQEGTLRLTSIRKLSGQVLAVHRLTFRNRVHGFVAVAVAPDRPNDLTTLRPLLGAFGDRLAVRLHLEAVERDRLKLRAELTEQFRLADVGELVSPVAHEVNNFLNVLLLQVAVMEQDPTDRGRLDFGEIRRQSAGLAVLVKQLQNYRRANLPSLEAVDLNRAVREAVQALRADGLVAAQDGAESVSEAENSVELADRRRPDRGAAPVILELAPELPPVRGSVADLKRLCLFLIKNAAAAVEPGGGRVWVHSEAVGRNVWLHVEDNGPTLAQEALDHLFESQAGSRTGVNCLELAACKGLVRRLEGKMRGRSRPEGGLAITVELLREPEKPHEHRSE